MVGGYPGVGLRLRNDAGFTHNGALAGSSPFAPAGDSASLAAFVIGAIAGLIFHYMFSIETERFKIDDVLGVWPLHGLCGSWGGVATGIFGSKALFGAAKDVSFLAQLAGTLSAIVFALVAGFALFGFMKFLVGLRLEAHEEFIGSDRTIHSIESYPEDAL
jgi:Amt family ammonium transporter